MSGERIKVHLKAPAKVGTRWLKEGDEEVTAEEKAILEAEGLLEVESPAADIEADPGAIGSASKDEFDQAVAVRAKELSDAVIAEIVEEVCGPIIQERDQAKARVAELEAEIVEMKAIAEQSTAPGNAGGAGAAASKTSPPDGAAAPAETHTPPSAKTAPKKGAATTTKG